MIEKMKPSGIAWIGDIPENWHIKRMKYLSTLKGRIGWQGLTSDEYTDVGPYLITGVDFTGGDIDWNNCVHVSEDRWVEAPEIHIQNGDLLITKDGTVGKVAIVSGLNDKASLNSGVLLIKTHQGFDKKFLYWALLSDEFWTWFRFKNAGNSTIIHLYQNDFAEFSYTFPKTNEQLVIADFLDKQCAQIDSIISDIENQIEVLQSYKKSLITETVTKGLDRSVPMKDSGIEWIGEIPMHWGLFPLKNLTSTISKGATPDDISVDCDSIYCIRFIKAENIQNGILNNSPEFFIDKFANHQLTRSILAKNDLLFVIAGATIGKVAIMDEAFCPCNTNQAVCFIRFLDVYQEYIGFFKNVLQSNIIAEVIKLLTVQAAQPNLSMGNIANIKIPVPSEEEMEGIIMFLEGSCVKIDEIIENKQSQLVIIQEHKKSLIFEYVTGKRRVAEVKN